MQGPILGGVFLFSFFIVVIAYMVPGGGLTVRLRAEVRYGECHICTFAEKVCG